MHTIAATADLVPGSGIREILNAVLERGAQVLRLELGEPGFQAPNHVVEAAHVAALGGASYTQSAGAAELRAALTDRLSAATDVRYSPAQLVVTQGGVQGCALTMAALVSPGDEVLIPDPAWPNYEMQALLVGATPTRYPLRPENGFLPELTDIERLIGERTKVLVLNSPSNPTGAVYPAELVAGIVELAAARRVTVLSDEVYDQLVFEGSASHAVHYDPDHVVGVYSFSKTYAMTGWRVGYVAAPDWLAGTLVRLQEAQLSCVSAVSQAAALAALAGPQDVVDTMRQAYRQRRDLAVGLCRAAGVDFTTPHGAFYLMVALSADVDSMDMALRLIDEGVAVAPGTAFGATARSFVRVSLAAEEAVLREGLSRLLDWHARTEGGRLVRGHADQTRPAPAD